MHFIRFFVILSIIFISFHCSKKRSHNPVTSNNIESGFPLSVGNNWKYLSVEVKQYSYKPDTIISIDTMVLTIGEKDQNDWWPAVTTYISKSRSTTETAWFAESDSGLIAKGYDILAGTIPIFRSDVNNPILLIAADTSYSPWYNRNKTYEFLSDTIINLKSDSYSCHSIRCQVNGRMVSKVYYSDIGFVLKEYMPDTVINGTDSIFISKTLTLFNYTINK